MAILRQIGHRHSSKAIGPPTACFNYMLTWYCLLGGRGIIGNQPTYCHQLHELYTNNRKHNTKQVTQIT